MNKRRDIILLAALFAMLVLFAVFIPRSTGDDMMGEKATTHSSAPSGTMALLRWVQTLGYSANRLEYQEFALDDDIDVLFLLNVTETINQDHTDMILEWVARGGTLIIVDARTSLFHRQHNVLHELAIDIASYREHADGNGTHVGDDGDNSDEILHDAPVVQAVWYAPPIQQIAAETRTVLTFQRSDVVPLVGLPTTSPVAQPQQPGAITQRAVVIGMARGEGYIYVSSAIHPFTNAGLHTWRNGAMVLNLLQHVPTGGHVVFDEWHHGFFKPPSLRSILVSNPWGQALIYMLSVLVLYFILTGRRYGSPIPLPEEVAQRSSAEYIESMADLYQRGGKSNFIAHHYYTTFKRHIAKPYGMNPNTPDDTFIAELKRTISLDETDETTLRTVLARFQKKTYREHELLAVTSDADAFLAHMRQR